MVAECQVLVSSCGWAPVGSESPLVRLGRIQDIDSYGRDPFPPRDKKH